jgi:hypothetical protein
MRPGRLFSLCACFLALAAGFAAAAEVEFVRVWSAWRDAEAFDSISEYFTGREKTGRGVIVRTHPDARGGFYYLIRVNRRAAPLPGAKFVLRIITPDSPDVKTYAFPVDLPARSTVFQLGLTGADWAGPDVHPVAWKLELVSADDRLLASEQSFLWSKPEK